MRVALISTYDVRGGAARAAYRLLQGLRRLGHDCSLLVRRKESADPHVHEAALDRGPAAVRREFEAARIREECIDGRRTPISNTWFSLPAPGYDLSRHELIQQ